MLNGSECTYYVNKERKERKKMRKEQEPWAPMEEQSNGQVHVAEQLLLCFGARGGTKKMQSIYARMVKRGSVRCIDRLP